MTLDQAARNALALELGLTPQACPQVWKDIRVYFCSTCDCDVLVGEDCCRECGHVGTYDDVEKHVVLPCPYSDDPAACLWDGSLMRALGWGFTYEVEDVERTTLYDEDGNEYVGKTFTAALMAAYEDIKP